MKMIFNTYYKIFIFYYFHNYYNKDDIHKFVKYYIQIFFKNMMTISMI